MSEQRKKLFRVGIIGYGYVGKTFHVPYINAARGLELSAICSSQGDDVRKSHPGVVTVTEPKALCALPDLDIIVIASPNQTHRPFAEMALKAGKHVVVDKPFTLTEADAVAVIATAKSVGRDVYVFQNRRWDSDFLAIKQVITEGRLGAVLHFESAIDVVEMDVSTNWRFKQGAGAGRWYDLGPHLVDQALLLFGAPDRVSAVTRCLRASEGVDDWFLVTLHYPQRIVILRHSMVARAPMPRFCVQGTKGAAIKKRCDIQEDQLVANVSPSAPTFGIDPDPLVIVNEDMTETVIKAPRGTQHQFYEDLTASLDRSMPPLVNEAQMIATMCIIETASFAAKTGATQDVNLSADHRRVLAENRSHPEDLV